MTRIFSVVTILMLSQPAQAFRQQPLKTNARKNAKDESEAQIQGDPWQTIRDHVLSGGAGNATSQGYQGYVHKKNPAEDFPVGVYDITASSLSFAVQVRSGIGIRTPFVASLHNTGIEAVNVLKVEYNEADAKVRALIESPAGWISLLDTRNGFRWAENRAEFCKRQMSSPAQYCTRSPDKCQLLEGECLPKGLTLTVDSGFLEDQVIPLGTYDILEEARVQVGASLDSQVLYRFGDLEIGETVTVLKVEYVPSETRVRAQIEQKSKGLIGWISLLDTSDNFRWAENRAAFCARQDKGSWCWYYYHLCYVDEGHLNKWGGGTCTPHDYPAKMM